MLVGLILECLSIIMGFFVKNYSLSLLSFLFRGKVNSSDSRNSWTLVIDSTNFQVFFSFSFFETSLSSHFPCPYFRVP